MKHEFELTKWYADVAGDPGGAVILYSAELAWHGPTIHYTNLLLHRRGHPAASRYSLRHWSPPELRGDAIEWTSHKWKAEGRWHNLGTPIHEVLFESGEGSLEWRCLAPRSSAEFLIGAYEPIRGWGYVEQLRLSIAPWRLPIRQLRWGRFINRTDAIAWIDWAGAEDRRVVYLNGASVPAETITDYEIVLNGGDAVLAMMPVDTLREGPLGSTVLSVLPGLFPASALNIRERKWLSRATLRRAGRPDSVGMAIHEVVEWP